jgi:hypothetical protein
VLAKGLTVWSERKYEGYSTIKLTSGESGWAITSTIIEVVKLSRQEIAQDSQDALAFNVYAAHWTERVSAAVTANDVELLFVPAGGTGRFQLMGRHIFET